MSSDSTFSVNDAVRSFVCDSIPGRVFANNEPFESLFHKLDVCVSRADEVQALLDTVR